MSSQAGRLSDPGLLALRTGQDWARWLDQVRPAQPFGIQYHTCPRRPSQALAALTGLAQREGFAAARGDCGEGDAITTGPAQVRGDELPAPRAGAAARRTRAGPRRRPVAADRASAGGIPARRNEAIPRAQLARANQAAAQFFRGRLAASWVPGYLTRRGFGAATQRDWQAGYAPGGWDVLTRHLRALGYPATVIQAAGLAHRSRRGTLIDTFRDRAMLPIHGPGGVIAAFIGRAPDHAPPDVPKYINSPATSLYRKREVLFGLYEARQLLAHGARPVIAEGPLDAIAITTTGAGQFAGVAPCGTALTGEHIAALARACDLRSAGAVVAFDPDTAGRKAAVTAYHLLIPHTDTVAAAVLPNGKDPAQVLYDHGPEALAQTLAENSRPLADLVIDTEVDRWSRWLGYAEGQINALRAAAPLIAAMPSAHVARQVARLAHRLGLDYPTVVEAVIDTLDQP
jgi:DNA primase